MWDKVGSLGLGWQYLTAACRVEFTRAQDSVIQLYFSAGFWFPKSFMSDSLDHLTGAPWGLGTVGQDVSEKSQR